MLKLASSLAVLVLLLQGCASVPKGTTETTIVPESLDSPEQRAAIEQTIDLHKKEVTHCYQSLQKREPSPEVKFVAEFRVGTTGKVILSRVHETSVKDQSFQACMLTVINQLKFAKPKETMTVRVPFKFEAR